MAEGIWIGFAVGIVYALVETLSDQAIKIWVYNALGLKSGMLTPARYFTWEAGRLIAVHSDDLKRNAAAIPLFAMALADGDARAAELLALKCRWFPGAYDLLGRAR